LVLIRCGCGRVCSSASSVRAEPAQRAAAGPGVDQHQRVCHRHPHCRHLFVRHVPETMHCFCSISIYVFNRFSVVLEWTRKSLPQPARTAPLPPRL
jgi:hypothetical protein